MRTGFHRTKSQHFREPELQFPAYDSAMKIAAPNQPVVDESPGIDGFEIKRRPIVGFGLLMSSIIGTLAVLIYFGAWASADRIENRAFAAGTTESHIEGEWWEDGLIFACPLH
jgi:hypothetical protein